MSSSTVAPNESAAAWPEAMRDKTAARYLDCGRTKVWQLAAMKELHPVTYPGRQTRFLKSDLDAFLTRMAEAAK